MYRNVLIILTLLVVFSFGCGRTGQKSSQGTEQNAPGENRQEFGPGGGMRGGQGRFSAEDMAKRQTEQLGKFVTYTGDQETRIQEVNKKFAEQMMELRSGGPGMEMSDAERQEMRAKMEAMQADKEKEIKSILTEEQLKGYEEYQQEMQRRRQERMHQRPPEN